MLTHNEAAAELHRLAQAEAMIRMYREANGRDPSSMDELTQFMKGFEGQVKPTNADHIVVAKSNPELELIASPHADN